MEWQFSIRLNRLRGFQRKCGFLGFAIHAPKHINRRKTNIEVSTREDHQEWNRAVSKSVPKADEDAYDHVKAERDFEDRQPKLLERKYAGLTPSLRAASYAVLGCSDKLSRCAAD